MSSDLTLLIAGPLHPNTKKMVEFNESHFDQVLVSTWKGDEEKAFQGKNLRFIYNSLPDRKIHNAQNIAYQATSTAAGLKKVKTQFVIKARTDEIYNLSPLVQNRPRKNIITTNAFVRDASYCRYHFSDHLMYAPTPILKLSFENLRQYLAKKDVYNILKEDIPAEFKIGIFFMNACGYSMEDLLKASAQKAYHYVKQEMDIIDVEQLAPYSLRASSVGDIKNFRLFIKSDKIMRLHYAQSIEDLKPPPKKTFAAYKVQIKNHNT